MSALSRPRRPLAALSLAALAVAVAACTQPGPAPGAAPAASSPAGTAPAAAAPAQAAPGSAPAEPAAAPLQVEVYNAGDAGMFKVASVLVVGARDAILIDAQFGASQARELVERIKASGKRLTTIYISHGDPDYYFGLDTVLAAFPETKVVATAATVAHIRDTQAGKLAYWGPKLGADAPKRVVVPEVLHGDRLELEGQSLQIVGPSPETTVVWIPSIRTIAGGVPVVAGQHLFMADSQSPQARRQWLATLQAIQALEPQKVVPGHFAPGSAQTLEAVRFTADYIHAFEQESAQAKDAKGLIEAMKRRYPQLAPNLSLEISAKVEKGEMPWP